MDEIIHAIITRHSVRSYRKDPVPAQLLEQMIDAARYAPSGRNEQPWEFVVVTDHKVRKEIAELTDYGRFIADAGACVVVLCRPTKYFLEDGSAATQNILLAAHALGLGACWVAGHKKPYVDTIKKIIGAPQEMVLISLVAIGYALKEAHAKAKRPLDEVLHWEKY